MNIHYKPIIIIFLSLWLLSGTNQPNNHKYYDRKNGFVPDKETAVKIAEIVLGNIYGVKNIAKQKPFIVTVWSGIYSPPSHRI